MNMKMLKNMKVKKKTNAELMNMMKLKTKNNLNMKR